MMRVAILLASGLFAVPARADPPENADPAYAEWFRDLKTPDGLSGCCSISDCRPVAYRITDGSYEAFLDRESFPFLDQEKWTKVPRTSIVQRQDNPLGKPVACVEKSWRIFEGHQYKKGDIVCFVRPSET